MISSNHQGFVETTCFPLFYKVKALVDKGKTVDKSWVQQKCSPLPMWLLLNYKNGKYPRILVLKIFLSVEYGA